MTSRERMQCVFNGEKPDRYPAYESFWGETIERWRGEGLPEDVSPHDFFDLDLASCGGVDLTAQYEELLISEDETYKIVRDPRGITAQRHKSESGHTPHTIETPIKQPSDWWQYKERLAFNESRVKAEVFELARQKRDEGRYISINCADPYEQAWPVFGQVQIFMAMLEEPAVIADSLMTWADLYVDCLDYALGKGLDIDSGFFYGDMGYRNGTLFGPDVYRELVMPAHKRIVNFLHDNGKKAILHSCGQIKSFIPMLIEVGFDALQPLEAKAQQDVRELVPVYGRQLVFFGNMDVRVLSSTKEAIKQEVESKLAVFDGSWNYIFHSDHSLPQTVSMENYAYALQTARNYLAGR